MKTNPGERVHEDVEFEVSDYAMPHNFPSFAEAAALAVTMAASGKEHVYIDILVWSEEGARALAGDDGVEQYREDPEASVFERLEVKVNNMGRVP